jgi:hypothetical protein
MTLSYQWKGAERVENSYERSLANLVIWTKSVLDRVIFTDFTLCSAFTANSTLATVVSMNIAGLPRLWAEQWAGARPNSGTQEYWTRKQAPLKTECHTNMNEHPEAASVVQQVYKALSETENLAGHTAAEVGKSSGWTSIVNRS